MRVVVIASESSDFHDSNHVCAAWDYGDVQFFRIAKEDNNPTEKHWLQLYSQMKKSPSKVVPLYRGAKVYCDGIFVREI